MTGHSPPAHPEHWRNKAKQARIAARLMDRNETKGRLLAIAEDYDQLAEQAEQQQGGRVGYR
jgi:hypothetical protein